MKLDSSDLKNLKELVENKYRLHVLADIHIDILVDLIEQGKNIEYILALDQIRRKMKLAFNKEGELDTADTEEGAEAKPGDRIGTNTGHGHVWTRPDGLKARCGGPKLCSKCAADLAYVHSLPEKG